MCCAISGQFCRSRHLSYIPSFNFVKWKYSHVKTKVELERKQVARELYALLCVRDLSFKSYNGSPKPTTLLINKLLSYHKFVF